MGSRDSGVICARSLTNAVKVNCLADQSLAQLSPSLFV